MGVIVRIPTPFQDVTGGLEEVELEPGSIIGLVGQLEIMFPGMRGKLVSDGTIRSYINILVNGTDIRLLQDERTKVYEGDEVVIVPAIAGG